MMRLTTLYSCLAAMSLTMTGIAWGQPPERSKIFDLAAAPDSLTIDSFDVNVPATEMKVLRMVTVDPAPGNVAGLLQRGTVITGLGNAKSPVDSVTTLDLLVSGLRSLGDTTVKLWVADPVGNPTGYTDRANDVSVEIPIPPVNNGGSNNNNNSGNNNGNNNNNSGNNSSAAADAQFLLDQLGLVVKIVGGRVVVDRVEAAKPASGRLGANDVISQVNGSPVDSVAKIVAAIKARKSDKVKMQIYQGGVNGLIMEPEMTFVAPVTQSTQVGIKCKYLDWVGLIVTDITDPATATVLQVGDVIADVVIGGSPTPVANAGNIDYYLNNSIPAGSKLELNVRRNGQTIQPAPQLPADIVNLHPVLGMEYVAMGTKWKVQSIPPNCLAGRMGLAVGDILESSYSRPGLFIDIAYQTNWNSLAASTFGIKLLRGAQQKQFEYSPELGMSLELDYRSGGNPVGGRVVAVDLNTPASRGQVQANDIILMSPVTLFGLLQTATSNGHVDLPIQRGNANLGLTITLRATQVDQLVVVNNYTPYRTIIFKKLPGQSNWDREPPAVGGQPVWLQAYAFAGQIPDSHQFRAPFGTEIQVLHEQAAGMSAAQVLRAKETVANSTLTIDFGRQPMPGATGTTVSLDEVTIQHQAGGGNRLFSWDISVVRVLNSGLVAERIRAITQPSGQPILLNNPPYGLSQTLAFTRQTSPPFSPGSGLGAGTWWVVGEVVEQSLIPDVLLSPTHPIGSNLATATALSSFSFQVNPVRGGGTTTQTVDLIPSGGGFGTPALTMQFSIKSN